MVLFVGFSNLNRLLQSWITFHFLMCIENKKDIKLYNGTICSLDDIQDDKLIVNGNSYDASVFLNTFEPNFCQTIYKYQGATISESYTIHELNIMTKRELYTWV